MAALDRFKIVFDRLEEATAIECSPESGQEAAATTVSESEEIAELRRIVLEVIEPEPATFTTT